MAVIDFYPDTLICGQFGISDRQLREDKRRLRKNFRADFTCIPRQGGLTADEYELFKRYRELLRQSPRSAKAAIKRLKLELEHGN